MTQVTDTTCSRGLSSGGKMWVAEMSQGARLRVSLGEISGGLHKIQWALI